MLEPGSFRVKLPGDVTDALIRVALQEFRLPPDQVAAFVTDGLKRMGELPDRKLSSPVLSSPVQPRLPGFDDGDDDDDEVGVAADQIDPEPDPEPWEAC